ncbi:kyphoscoliosis peptidase-like [Ruditapes philippinarum]|uniref:kyphoscoliosis peptidase-like n=1 Tax=Ruditapes philippinarum TaxID=129788 RepID=UPI00295AD6E9|nr:kyphoscoliosis peptidase-like [Ruditapes philippinarum]
MRNSTDLVTYFSSFSKDTRMIVRGIFVWISENIRYDVNGYLGRSSMAPCDGQSVLTCGKSVCAGYARAFELLCRDAAIPVKTISGFSKGFGYSPSEPISFKQNTDHAWNAVQLEGKWHLLDCTWGAGYVEWEKKYFKKAFDEFYFLTDPKEFVSDHFPYMDNNIEESQKWQLLSKPISLEKFSSNVKYSPQAFKLGVLPVSHKKAYFEMRDELQMTLHSTGNEDIYINSRLMLEYGQKVQENATFCYQENGLFKILVHPRKPGMYTLDIFGKSFLDTTNEGCSHLMRYNFKCTKVTDKNHEYPTVYRGTFVEKCLLHEPLNRRLPSKTEIQFRISSPVLQQIMIDHTYFEKNGTMFTGKITTGAKGHKVNILGKRTEPESNWTHLFSFCTI